MSSNSLGSKLRQWDNKSSQWILRHFYVLFFEVVLVVMFVFFFGNSMSVVEGLHDVNNDNFIEKMLLTQSIHQTLMVLLMLFNSFWMLFMFRSLLSMRSSLRSVEYNISKMRQRDRKKLGD